MPSPEVKKLATDVRNALRIAKDNDLSEAVNLVKNDLEVLMPGLALQLEEQLEEAREIVAQEIEGIEILHSYSVMKKRLPWYSGPKPGDRHWPVLKEYIAHSKNWHPDNVAMLDETSTEVVSLLEDPSQTKFSCRGLVVGHVQAGKTANMTAVIAKALDVGYNTVIVLAGLTNKLRFQTQTRLFQDLIGRNPELWDVLTPNQMYGDFRAPPQGGFRHHSDKVQIAVVKKNVSPLNQLKNAVRRVLPVELPRLRILLIDDECDQASVNAAHDELDMTAINQKIRELLKMFPAVSYVGYTATPFANVLIDPYPAESLELDDLYPRDFITTLPTPNSYFGAERLFGYPPSDPDNLTPDEEGLDMIRIVPPEEEHCLQPASRNERTTFQPMMANTLENAILYFLACCAARRVRGDGNEHMTMLVHTSPYVIVHQRLAAIIQGWYEINRGNLLDRYSDLSQRLTNIWISETKCLPKNMTEAPDVSIDEIFEKLSEVLDALEFPIENGASDDRIDYTGEPRTYIVVGGSILARGLTLESLMVSYFLRSANQYDTLLQMGRWFGFRPYYEDLPRIWMTEDLRFRFRLLAGVEQEIRDEIEQYQRFDLSPMELAVRIPNIPGMAITAANKMRAARQCAISFWGTHRQTFRFNHRDKSVLRKNWNAASELINTAEALARRDSSCDAKLWRDVPKSSILRFFKDYKVHSTHPDLSPEILLPFLEKRDPRLSKWNVGIVEASRGDLSDRDLGIAGKVRLVKRSRLKARTEIADIKALMSRGDIRLDCNNKISAGLKWEDLKDARLEDVGQVPLLLLYAIDKNSEPQDEESILRVPLGAEAHVLGFGVVFPGSVTEGGEHVSVRLKPLFADELDEDDIVESEKEQAEAAGIG